MSNTPFIAQKLYFPGGTAMAYRPMFNCPYAGIAVISPDPIPVPALAEGETETDPPRVPTPQPERIEFEYATPRDVSRKDRLTHSKKKHINQNDYVFDDKGVAVSMKNGVLYQVEEIVTVKEYGSPPITEKESVEAIKAWLEANKVA